MLCIYLTNVLLQQEVSFSILKKTLYATQSEVADNLFYSVKDYLRNALNINLN